MFQIILTQFLTIIIVDLTVPMFNFAGELKMLICRTLAFDEFKEPKKISDLNLNQKKERY